MSSSYENELYMSALPQEQSQETVNHAEIKQNYLARKLKALALSTLATVGTMGAVTMSEVKPAEACTLFTFFCEPFNEASDIAYNQPIGGLNEGDAQVYCTRRRMRYIRGSWDQTGGGGLCMTNSIDSNGGSRNININNGISTDFGYNWGNTNEQNQIVVPPENICADKYHNAVPDIQRTSYDQWNNMCYADYKINKRPIVGGWE
jgi:hypothetical protein